MFRGHIRGSLEIPRIVCIRISTPYRCNFFQSLANLFSCPIITPQSELLRLHDPDWSHMQCYENISKLWIVDWTCSWSVFVISLRGPVRWAYEKLSKLVSLSQYHVCILAKVKAKISSRLDLVSTKLFGLFCSRSLATWLHGYLALWLSGSLSLSPSLLNCKCTNKTLILDHSRCELAKSCFQIAWT